MKYAGARARLGVDLLDRLREGLTGREAPVGLDGERHGDGEAMLRRRPDDADRLLHVGDRERGHDVHGCVGKHTQLPRVVRLRLVGGHPALGVVGITLRADRRAEHYRPARDLLQVADLRHEPDRATVCLGQIFERVAELRTPGGVGAPGVRLEHEADTVTARDLQVRLEVAGHSRPSVVPFEQGERREAREVETVAEDQRRLHSTVGEEHVSAQLWERLAVPHATNRTTHRMAVQRAAPPYTRVMREHDLELLELPAVLARLAAAAASEPGALLAVGLRPSADADEVRLRQQPTTEAIVLLDEAAEPDLGGVADVTDAAERAARGSTLDTRSLSLIERTIRAGTAGVARSPARRRFRAAGATAGIDVSLLSVAEEIGRSVEEDGSDLKDSASPVLRRLRRELREGRGKLAERLRKIARDPALAEHLQDDFVTERGGRPVLALKASARGRVPGIVHDSSGSGQTLFVEPLAAVEDSNRLREAEVAERDEVARILRNLSSLVAGQAEPLIALARAAAELDLVISRGTLSRGWRGALVTPSREVIMRGARHPLLEKASAVPIDLELGSLRALVISGPNTGGKTVALKTLGLAAALYQSGLRPPADEASLPVFDEILVDIGDEQSIAMSLSTFSAHLRNLVGILERATASHSCSSTRSPPAPIPSRERRSRRHSSTASRRRPG